MKLLKRLFILSSVMLGLFITVPACVQCTPSGNLWVCVASPQGGFSCATSTNQQQCVLNGVCRPPGYEEGEGGNEGKAAPCEVKRFGRVTISQATLDAISSESKMFGKALTLARSSLGNNYTRVFTFEGKSQVEIAVELIDGSLRLTRSDGLASLELFLTRDFDFSVTDEEKWVVNSWLVK